MTYQSPFACMNNCAQGSCRNRTTGCEFECEARKEQEQKAAKRDALTQAPQELAAVSGYAVKALACMIEDLEATYNAAKTGKPLEISIGQFGRLDAAKRALLSLAQSSEQKG